MDKSKVVGGQAFPQIEKAVADRLAALYDQEFGGKERGRFRISMKHLRALTGRRRVPSSLVQKIAEEMTERGYVFIDLETYFVVLAERTFRGYRRVSDSIIGIGDPETES